VLVLSTGVGNAIGLPGWTTDFAQHTAGTLALVVGLTILLVLPFALAASAGRGYLPPFGCMLLAVILAQMAASIGWGPYFPWAVAGLAGTNGPETLGIGSYALVLITALAGILCTLAWWRYADQT
jgi:ABC-2 type transport system permease protein